MKLTDEIANSLESKEGEPQVETRLSNISVDLYVWIYVCGTGLVMLQSVTR